ncbi:MAG TPA: ABC transporter permease [Luteitalea sp.]|nr:ABC transporter permease [Luteitalea sp.]
MALRALFRGLWNRRAFTATIVLTLGLGIGAATTVWSFAYALLYRPYPYPAPERLVRVQSASMRTDGTRRGMSLLDLDDYQRRVSRLSGIGAFTVFDNRLLSDGPPSVVRVAHVTASVLPTVGVAPVMGRVFTPDEDRSGGDVHKAVIAHSLWHSMFAGDPGIIGKPLRTDRLTYIIVGVMPAGFGFPDRALVWVPMESYYASLPSGDERRQKWRGARWYDTIARLAPDATLAEAAADVSRVAATLRQEYPADNDAIDVVLTPLRTFEIGEVRPYVLACVAGVLLVLLICCTNVANLLIVRAIERRRQVAIQMALGAGWSRVTAHLLTESLVLGLLGSSLGLLLALGGVQGLLALVPVPLPAWMVIEVYGAVLSASILAGVASAMVFTLGPLIASARIDLTTSLRQGARGNTRSTTGAWLVTAEVALSVILLVGAGLLLRTFVTLQQRDPGFEGAGVAAARVVLWAPGSRQEAAGVLAATHQRVLDALTVVPGVQSAAVTNSLPYTGASAERIQADIFVEGRAQQETRTVASIAGADVSPGYFETLGIPLVKGRLFDAGDTTTSPPVVIVSERAARLFWPDQDPIGRLVSWGKPTPQANPWTRVVGVVGDVAHGAAEGATGVEFYYPIAQWPVATSFYVVRTSLHPDHLLAPMRTAILGAEPQAAVTSVMTMEQRMNESLWQRRLWSVLFAGFATLALALAVVGIYGVISYAVAQRTRELGVRLALGAEPVEIRRLVLREGMWWCTVGAASGTALAFGLARVVTTLLFGVSPYDWVTYGTVLATVLSAALAACWIPAQRASRIAPSVALRAE